MNILIHRQTAVGHRLNGTSLYRELQKLAELDWKTSSWVATPSGLRDLGCALLCDRPCDRVFSYHNGDLSYYAGRGFRGVLRV